jgi:hypothetical protein
VGLRAVRRHFSPEFVNRIDAVITYRPLGNESLVAILEQHVVELQHHVQSRLGNRSFDIQVEPAARFFMLDKGTSVEYGARELRRIIHRHLTQPLAAMVANGNVAPGAVVTVDLDEEGDRLTLVAVGGMPRPAVLPSTILVVDDNEALLQARAVVMSGAQLDEEEQLLCQRYDIPFLQKPFVAEELLSALEAISLSGGSSRSAMA